MADHSTLIAELRDLAASGSVQGSLTLTRVLTEAADALAAVDLIASQTVTYAPYKPNPEERRKQRTPIYRIANLTDGMEVTLRFHYGAGQFDDERHTFGGLYMDGDTQNARFRDSRTGSYWSAYRFNGRWCFGTSAQRLQVVSI